MTDTLLNRGCPPGNKNKHGETPLHLECRQVREASLHVVDSLLRSGAEAEPNAGHNITLLSPLTFVLQRGADATTCVYENEDGNGNVVETCKVGPVRKGGKRHWCPVAARLLQAGAKWNPTSQTPEKRDTQLHLLLSAYAPARDQMEEYLFLLDTALSTGVNPLLENKNGKNCIFVFCEAISHVSDIQYPESREILTRLMQVCSSEGIGGTDRYGLSVFDIAETLPNSSLIACRKLLQKGFAGISDQSLSGPHNYRDNKFHHQIRSESNWGGKSKEIGARSKSRNNKNDHDRDYNYNADDDDATISTKNSSTMATSTSTLRTGTSMKHEY